jgi:pyruvate/2-oxoglutarate dehydrogenase complex dihydrolipoamide dehydrogenase (E3) component
MPERYDAVVVGGGPTGEHAVGILSSAGKKVALVEREFVGGECSGWACIPTKTLLRPTEVQGEADTVAGVSEPSLDWPKIREYRNYMTVNWDDSERVKGYEESGVKGGKGGGGGGGSPPPPLAGPGKVEAGGETLEADHVLLATGSAPRIPDIDGLDEAGYWTNREAMEMNELPRSVVILGGGPVGAELAQMYKRFGAGVSVVQHGDHLVAREEPGLSDLLARILREDGVDVLFGRSAKAVRRDDGERVVTLDDGTELRGEQFIVATGRAPRTDGLGLETVGVEPGKRGEVPVDERCRATDGVWAAGDVTGVALFTHLGKYQARVAVANMLWREAKADYRAIPRVVFTHPEVAAVGLTEQQARDQGIDVETVEVELVEEISRPYTYEELHDGDWGGTLKLVADRERQVLVGAWAASPLASEWIHQAVLAIRAKVPLDVLGDTIPGFPSYSEAMIMAVRKLCA